MTLVIRGNPKLCSNAEPFGRAPCNSLSLNQIFIFQFFQPSPIMSSANTSCFNFSNFVENFRTAVSESNDIDRISITVYNMTVYSVSSQLGQLVAFADPSELIDTSQVSQIKISFRIFLSFNANEKDDQFIDEIDGTLLIDPLNELSLLSEQYFVISNVSMENALQPEFYSRAPSIMEIRPLGVGDRSQGIAIFGSQSVFSSRKGLWSLAFRPHLTTELFVTLQLLSSSLSSKFSDDSESISDDVVSTVEDAYSRIVMWDEIPMSSRRIAIFPCDPMSRVSLHPGYHGTSDIDNCLHYGVDYDIKIVARFPEETLESEFRLVSLPKWPESVGTASFHVSFESMPGTISCFVIALDLGAFEFDSLRVRLYASYIDFVPGTPHSVLTKFSNTFERSLLPSWNVTFFRPSGYAITNGTKFTPAIPALSRSRKAVSFCGALFDASQNISRSLKASKPYLVKVSSQLGFSEPKFFLFTMPDAPPNGPPVLASVQVTGRNVVVFLLQPLEPNGVIISVAVVVTMNGTSDVNRTYSGTGNYSAAVLLTSLQRQQISRGEFVGIAVPGLLPISSYGILLLACTSVGCGPGADVNVSTGEETPSSIEMVSLAWRSSSSSQLPQGVLFRSKGRLLEIRWAYREPRTSRKMWFEVYVNWSSSSVEAGSGVLVYNGSALGVVVRAHYSDVFSVRAVSPAGASRVTASFASSAASEEAESSD